jgi:hypothetical protein
LCSLGDKPISKFKYRLFATVAAPLILGGCGFPVAVQVASLIADGISVVATDKTLTDHGLSIVAEKDCAVWRGIKGEDICKQSDDLSGQIMVSELPDHTAKPVETADEEPAEPLAVEAETFAPSAAPLLSEPAVEPADEPELAALDENDFDSGAISFSQVSAEDVEPEIVENIVIIEKPKSAPPLPQTRVFELAPVKPNVRPDTTGKGGTFYVIASYHRAADAERFARKQSRLETTVLSGTAKGKSVYRVAVGPVTKPQRRSTKEQLTRSGYRDVWKLKLKKPTVIVEVASLE